MSEIISQLQDKTIEVIESVYQKKVDSSQITFQETKKEFLGDITMVVFPLIKLSSKSPEATATELGTALMSSMAEIESFNVIKGFLNLKFHDAFWLKHFDKISPSYGLIKAGEKAETVMVEYSSPNTNKPLHLGHIRNNLLGFAVAEILKANGKKVIKANLVNDRGIHICKSMLAWQKWGNNETPDSSGLKGDHLVGKYYVIFDKEYKKQIEELKLAGQTEEEGKKNAGLIKEAQEMLLKWEQGDTQVMDLWKKMNGWVYEGFGKTYKTLGVDFDEMYYESKTYLLGKNIVEEGLKSNVFFKKPDGSVWIDLTDEGLDEKLVLRADGTSVYITQDIGTAEERFSKFHIDQLIYVVGNEQDYHFKVLQLILKKLGRKWWNEIFHLSYGMVDLPSGRMKSREGTVVDADDLVEEMINTAKKTTEELGKTDGMEKGQADNLYHTIGLGALKYFILKVDPKKKMLFNPEESIDFNGNTGPFIQYTYARIQSVLRKAIETGRMNEIFDFSDLKMEEKERELIKLMVGFPEYVKEAGSQLNPAVIANYLYELAKAYNQFYHEHSILVHADGKVKYFRLVLSRKTSEILYNAASMLGISLPERM